MTGPRPQIDPFADLAEDPFADLNTSIATPPKEEEKKKKGFFGKLLDEGKRNKQVQNNAARSTAASLFSTLDRGAKAIGGSKGAFGNAADALRAGITPVAPAEESLGRITDMLNNFLGSAAVSVPVGIAASAALAPASAATIGAGMTRALGSAAMSAGAKKAIVAGVSALPGQFLGNVAISPEDATSPMGLGLTAFGAATEGLGAFLGNMRSLKVLADDPASPVATKDLIAEVDKFRATFEKLTVGEPSSGFKAKTELEIPTTLSAKPIDLKQGGRKLIPNDEEFSYFQKEATKLTTKRMDVEKRIRTSLKGMKEEFSEKRLDKLNALHEELRSIDNDYQKYVAPWLNESGAERNPLVKGALGGAVRWGRNTAENFENPFKGEIDLTPSGNTTKGSRPSVKIETPENIAYVGPKSFSEAVSRANIDYSGKPVPEPKPTLFQKSVDRLKPLEKLSPETYDQLNNLGATRREAEIALTKQMAMPVMENGVWSGKSTALNIRPLNVIVKDAGSDVRALEALIKARRTLAQPDIDSGMKISDAEAIVSQASDKLHALANETKLVTDYMIDYQVTMGRISTEAGERMKSVPYAPLGRSFNNPSGSNFRAKRTGSDKASKPIFEQLSNQMFEVIEQSKKNYAYSKLAEKFDGNPNAYEGVMEYAGPLKPDAFKAQLDEMVKEGMTVADAREALEATLGGSLDRSDGTLIVFRNGVGQKYRVSPPLRMAVESLNPLETSFFTKALRDISIPLRESVAAGMDLSGTGPLMDASMARMVEPSFNMLISPIKGAWHVITKSPEYLESVRAGRGFGGRFRTDLIQPNYNPASSTLEKVVQTATKPVRVFTSATEALNDFIRPLSDASRMGLYLARKAKGDTPVEAAAFSNNALGNWNRVGASMRAWSMATEFGNVGIQGSEAIGRAISRASKDPKLAANLIGVGVASITIPTIYFWSAAQEDPELNALRKGSNYDYWWWRRADGSFGKTRKIGWGMAPIFGGSIEAALDGMDARAAKALADSFMKSVMFNPMPVSIQTGLGLMNNDRAMIDPTREIPIVPRSQIDTDPIAQGDGSTSNLANGMKPLGVSPYKIDYILNSVLGADGMALIKMATGGNVSGGERGLILGRYDVPSRTPTEGSVKFYNDLARAQEVDKTLNELKTKGDVDMYRMYASQNPEFVGAYEPLAKIAAQVGQINKALRNISADPKMSKEGKENAEKELRAKINEVFSLYKENSPFGKPAELPVNTNPFSFRPESKSKEDWGVSDTTKIYNKNGKRVYDTQNIGSDGRKPTHNVESKTNRRENETWEQYEERVLRSDYSGRGIDTVNNKLDSLQPDARNSISRLIEAARADGIELRIGETLRAQERQESLFQKGRSKPGGVVTWTLTSNHTPGNAADLVANSQRGYDWIQANGPKFGLNVLGAKDPGHVEYLAK